MKSTKAFDFIAKFYVYLLLVIVYAPILVLIIFSFTDTRIIGNWNGFTFDLYRSLVKNAEIMAAVKNTFLVALSASVISTVLGTLGAIGIFYSSRRSKAALEGASQIPVLNAEIVTALSLTVLFVFFGIHFNFLTLLIGHVVLTVPFVVLSVKPKLMQMDPNVYEAALDLGATPSRALWRVIFPEIVPGIISGFILSITLSLDDYIITAFTRDNSFATLSTYVYGVTSKKGTLPPSLRALTTMITILALVVLLIANYRSKREKQQIRK